MKTCILEKEPAQLKEELLAHGMKSFVANQVMEWIYKKSKTSFEEMSNISKENQKILSDHYAIAPLTIEEKLISKEQAVKFLFKAEDGLSIESVVLIEKNYNALCVSSQAGCPVDCKFCVTGANGFKRQLTSGEILAQVLIAQAEGYPISNLVFMGMGEPLLNYDNVMKALDTLTGEDGFHKSRRKITLSTAGYLPGIKRLIKEEKWLSLAFSVGHASSDIRRKFMPIDDRYPIEDVVKTLHDYSQLHNRKLTLEYTFLEGINDDDQAMQELSGLAKFLNAKVNLINLNPHPLIPYKPISTKRLHQCKHILLAKGVRTTIRFRKGQDISAACGQLGDSLNS